jgi:TonB family protein
MRIHVGNVGTRLAFSLEVERGDEVIDSLQTTWATAPRKISPPMFPGALRVGGDVRAPVVLNRVEPVYPEVALRARISGIVIVETVIGRDGMVKDVRVMKPLPFGLDQAAVDAVKQWTFKPGTLNGEAVDVIFNLTVNFKLATPPPPPPPV